MSRAPPPSSAPAISKEMVEVVKRKIAPPANPPPAGMVINFSAPKQVAKKALKRNVDDEYQSENDEDDHRDDRRGRGQDSRDRDRDHDRRDSRDYDDYDRRDRRDSRDYDDYDRRDRRDSRDRDDYDRRDRRDSRDRDDYDRRGRRDSRDSRDSRDYDSRDGDRPRRDYREYDDEDDDYDSQEEYDADRRSMEAPRKEHLPVADTKEALRKGLQSKDTAADAKRPEPQPVQTMVTKPQAGAASGAAAAAGPGRASTTSRLTIFNYEPILRSTYRELRAFVISPCQQGIITRCYIERNRSGSKMLAPFFSLCADLEDGTGRELMVCRKVMQSRSSHYVFSLKSEDLFRTREKRSKLFLGKLRAVSSTDYVLYDNGTCAAPDEPTQILDAIEAGDSPTVEPTALAKKAERDRKADSKSSDEVSLYRKELVVVHFNTKSRPPPKGQRGMEVCLPAAMASAPPAGSGSSLATSVPTNKATVCNINKPFEKIRQMGKQNQMYSKTCMVYHEKSSRYDPLSSCLVDFRGRAHMASVKNFQLVASEPLNPQLNAEAMQEQMHKQDAEKEFILQMGKTTEDCFNMDYRHPLSLLQAFAICIARFDAKLTW